MATPVKRSPPAKLRASDSVRQAPMIGGVLLLTALAYLRCLGDRFVLDDNDDIVANRYVAQWSFLWKSLVNGLWWFRDPAHLPQSSNYRPLQNIWYDRSRERNALAAP